MPKVRIKPTKLPSSKGKVEFNIKGELNITAFTARQKVTRYLILHVGNLLGAGEPKLWASEDQLKWDVPVVYTLPRHGVLGTVGHILVDAQNGDLQLNQSTSKDEIQLNAKRLYQEATSQASA